MGMRKSAILSLQINNAVRNWNLPYIADKGNAYFEPVGSHYHGERKTHSNSWRRLFDFMVLLEVSLNKRRILIGSKSSTPRASSMPFANTAPTSLKRDPLLKLPGCRLNEIT
jgi:hypothetical protein